MSGTEAGYADSVLFSRSMMSGTALGCTAAFFGLRYCTRLYCYVLRCPAMVLPGAKGEKEENVEESKCQVPICLRAAYAISGTDQGIVLSIYILCDGRCICLCACYAMSGTDIAYGSYCSSGLMMPRSGPYHPTICYYSSYYVLLLDLLYATTRPAICYYSSYYMLLRSLTNTVTRSPVCCCAPRSYSRRTTCCCAHPYWRRVSAYHMIQRSGTDVGVWPYRSSRRSRLRPTNSMCCFSTDIIGYAATDTVGRTQLKRNEHGVWSVKVSTRLVYDATPVMPCP
eukprot:3535356-Rhodomonas_salina.2